MAKVAGLFEDIGFYSKSSPLRVAPRLGGAHGTPAFFPLPAAPEEDGGDGPLRGTSCAFHRSMEGVRSKVPPFHRCGDGSLDIDYPDTCTV